MRLKEIKPGMAIHCKNDKEMKALLGEAERLGYIWNKSNVKPTEIRLDCIGSTIHFYDKSRNGDHKHITWSNKKEGATEFSDLILPELTAEEVLEICHEICRGKSCNECLMSGNCFVEDKPDFTKVIEICKQWKSDHEKKEPEIEWVYRVFGAENYGEKFFQTEDEAIKRCEELAKSQETKQYARYERACRVKAVE